MTDMIIITVLDSISMNRSIKICRKCVFKNFKNF